MSEEKGQVMWMQAMTNFRGSPADTLVEPQDLSLLVPSTGSVFSIILSNECGEVPLEIVGAAARVGSVRVPITFGRNASCVIPAGKSIESDLFALGPRENERIHIELDPGSGQRPAARGSSVDRTMVRVSSSRPEEPQYYFGLKALVCHDAQSHRSVCLFGDSLTNQGRYAGPASLELMERVGDLSVFNCGISGNRLLRDGDGESLWAPSFGPAGVDRFERDVTLSGRIVPDVVFAMIGVNDLYQAGGTAPIEQLPTADELIAGLKRIEKTAAGFGACMLFGTVTPFKGAMSHECEAWSEEKESTRCAVNEWLRSHRDVVDIDGIVSHKDDASRLDDRFDCGDHLHFSEKGGAEIGRLVANAIYRKIRL